MSASTTKLTVSVTRDDIIEGVRCVAACCPVAKAIQRASGSPKWRVFEQYATSPFGREYKLPSKAQKFIEAFDKKGANRAALKPFSFVLELA